MIDIFSTQSTKIAASLEHGTTFLSNTATKTVGGDTI